MVTNPRRTSNGAPAKLQRTANGRELPGMTPLWPRLHSRPLASIRGQMFSRSNLHRRASSAKLHIRPEKRCRVPPARPGGARELRAGARDLAMGRAGSEQCEQSL